MFVELLPGTTIAKLRLHPIHLVNAAQPQVAADLWTKLISLSHGSGHRQL